MKVVSLNLQGFFGWQQREARILAHLEAERPDVVLFQEVVYLPHVAPVPQPELLNRQLVYPWRHESVTRRQQSPDYGLYREGLAVLSAHPVSSTTTLVLQRAVGDPHERIVQLIDVEAPDGMWRFANVHLSIAESYAMPQLMEVLRMLEERGERRILVGDFNMDHLERHRGLWGADYELSSERFRFPTFPATGRCLDYLLVPNDVRLTSVHSAPTGLSDHIGLVATLDRS